MKQVNPIKGGSTFNICLNQVIQHFTRERGGVPGVPKTYTPKSKCVKIIPERHIIIWSFQADIQTISALLESYIPLFKSRC